MNFAGSSNSNSSHQKRVTKLIREDDRFVRIIAQDAHVQVMVSEVQCFDEGCVPLETMVILVSTSTRWIGKLLMPIAEVTKDIITADLAIPVNWWLHTMLFLLRKREPEIPASNIDSAYNWLIKNKTSGSMLEILESLSTSEDKADAEQALLFLSKCVSRETLLRAVPTAASAEVDIDASNAISSVDASTSKAPLTKEPTLPTHPTLPSPTDLTPKQPSVLVPSQRAISSFLKPTAKPLVTRKHDKNAGVRQRGCPCCDPDNIDNIVDSMFMSSI